MPGDYDPETDTGSAVGGSLQTETPGIPTGAVSALLLLSDGADIDPGYRAPVGAGVVLSLMVVAVAELTTYAAARSAAHRPWDSASARPCPSGRQFLAACACVGHAGNAAGVDVASLPH